MIYLRYRSLTLSFLTVPVAFISARYTVRPARSLCLIHKSRPGIKEIRSVCVCTRVYLHDERVAPKFCAWFAIKSLERSDKRTGGFTVRLTTECNMRQTSFANAWNTPRVTQVMPTLERGIGNLSRRGEGRNVHLKKYIAGYWQRVLWHCLSLHIAPWFYTTTVAYSWNYAQFTTRSTIQQPVYGVKTVSTVTAMVRKELIARLS